MKKKDLDKVVATVGILTLAVAPPLEVMASTCDTVLVGQRIQEDIEEVDFQFETNLEKLDRLIKEAERVQAEREEAERLRKLEEAKLEKEKREREEINRKNSVTCDLDNVLKPSNLTTNELIAVFSRNEYSKNMTKLAHIFIEAEKKYGINAFIFSAIASWESDYGRSNRAINDNNYLGWGVENPNSKGINASSAYENIMNAGAFLKAQYLSPEGAYFNGYTTWGINQNYCLDSNGNPDDRWRIGVNEIAKRYEYIYKNYIKNI